MENTAHEQGNEKYNGVSRAQERTSYKVGGVSAVSERHFFPLETLYASAMLNRVRVEPKYSHSKNPRESVGKHLRCATAWRNKWRSQIRPEHVM